MSDGPKSESAGSPDERQSADQFDSRVETTKSLEHGTNLRLDDSDCGEKAEMASKAYRCRHCHKEFVSLSNLVHHTQAGHRPVHRKHNCSVCSYASEYKWNLLRHMRTHTKERPYFCQICSKSFIDSDKLRRHSATHSDRRPFSCEICFKRFKTKDSLSGHRVTHEPDRSKYQCYSCASKFYRKHDLLRHCEEKH